MISRCVISTVRSRRITARWSAYRPVSSVFADDLSSKTRMEATARTLNADWAGDGGTILAAMQAHHWCEMLIGLVGFGAFSKR